MRSLGLDVGERRTGVALSDPQGLIAFPLTVIEHKDEDTAIAHIARISEERGAARVVVGMPLMLDGHEGQQATKVRAFGEKLRAHVNIPVEFWDERLSTRSAQRALRESRAGRHNRNKAHADALAASYMLQSFLDRLRSSEET
jgi:putative Holliday junction resolvase